MAWEGMVLEGLPARESATYVADECRSHALACHNTGVLLASRQRGGLDDERAERTRAILEERAQARTNFEAVQRLRRDVWPQVQAFSCAGFWHISRL